MQRDSVETRIVHMLKRRIFVNRDGKASTTSDFPILDVEHNHGFNIASSPGSAVLQRRNDRDVLKCVYLLPSAFDHLDMKGYYWSGNESAFVEGPCSAKINFIISPPLKLRNLVLFSRTDSEVGLLRSPTKITIRTTAECWIDRETKFQNEYKWERPGIVFGAATSLLGEDENVKGKLCKYIQIVIDDVLAGKAERGFCIGGFGFDFDSKPALVDFVTEVDLEKGKQGSLQFKFPVDDHSADVSFVVEKVKIMAHKFVLSNSSAVFCKLFEARMRESQTGTVHIGESSVASFNAFLQYIYQRDSTAFSLQAMSDLNFCLQVLRLASMYEIADLRALCIASVLHHIRPATVVKVLHAACLHGVQELKDECLRFIVISPLGRTILLSKRWYCFALSHPDVIDSLDQVQ
jgi:hypothetical protein